MPTTIDSRSRTTANKPLTPALSSNLRKRPANGLTPRLAAARTLSPAAAPQPQRSLRQQTLSPDRSFEDRAISLNTNVTPRSGARSSRVDTQSPATPDTAGIPRRMAVASEESVMVNHGLGISSPVHTPTRANSSDQVSFLPTANWRRISGASTASTPKDDSKFFRVDDLKTGATTRAHTSSPKLAHTSQLPSPRVSPRKGVVSADTGYASKAPSSIARSPKSSSVARSSSVITTFSQPLTYEATSPLSPNARPPLTVAKTSTPRAVLQQIPPAAQNARLRSSSTTQSPLISPLDRRRSSSLNFKPSTSITSKSHRKSASTSSSSIDNNSPSTPYASVQKRSSVVSIADSDISSLDNIISPPLEKAASTAGDVARPQCEVVGNTDTAAVSDLLHQTQKARIRHLRGSSEATAIQPVTREQLEAASNARRERKVLDLEISNSSLLAINKTLEKELRKQNVELRRFRRLSRSGRLSLNTSNRIVSGASMSTLATLEESDYTETYHESHLDDSEPDSLGLGDEDDNLSDEDSSVTGSSEIARRRARDEKKLMLDLQRHQQILLDSQKLTQSIQRCLNTTDELLKEGDKALAYRVEEKDVQIGGKVLNQDDDEALSEVDFDSYQESVVGPRQALLSPSIAKTHMEEAIMVLNSMQVLDGQHDTNHYFSERPRTKSPSPTLGLSPVLLSVD